MKLSITLRFTLLILVLCGTVGCDQTTKHFARTRLSQFNSVMFLGGLGELRLAENPGAFLSLGASLTPATRTLIFTGMAGSGLLALFIFLLLRPQSQRRAFTGLALVLAGGASNLIDRLTQNGLVTDFLMFRCGPLQTGVFNVADMIVMLGLTLFLWAALQNQNSPPTAKPKPD
jgi:signal peptidase II